MIKTERKAHIRRIADANLEVIKGIQGNWGNELKAISQLAGFCMELTGEHNTVIVSAFPGTGKSHFYNNSPLRVRDSDSSKFDKAHFPGNYIEHIKSSLGFGDIIFVSSHEAVRKALVQAGLPFVLVYPQKDLIYEYLDRYKKRGSPQPFIDLIEANWHTWLDGCATQTGCRHIELRSGQFLSDSKLLPSLLMNAKNVRLGDKVLYTDLNWHFEVVGIREKELELVGDFSGIGHVQKSWVDINKLQINQ